MKVSCIGTRELPVEEYFYIKWIVEFLISNGFLIGSGCADGSDYTFAYFANRIDPTKVILYLPWEGYNAEYQMTGNRIVIYDPKNVDHQRWEKSVTQYHPNPSALTKGGYSLMARNYGIVEGSVLQISRKGLSQAGGTGQGITIAKDLRIPSFDLTEYECIKKLNRLLGLQEPVFFDAKDKVKRKEYFVQLGKGYGVDYPENQVFELYEKFKSCRDNIFWRKLARKSYVKELHRVLDIIFKSV